MKTIIYMVISFFLGAWIGDSMEMNVYKAGYSDGLHRHPMRWHQNQ